MNIVYLDAETASDLSVKDVGAEVYCSHASTRPILWGVLGESWSRAISLAQYDPFDVLQQLRDARRLKWGKRKNPLIVMHWSPFDRLLAQAIRPDGWRDDGSVYGVHGPLNTIWVDLSELALTAGMPGALTNAASFVGQELKAPGKKLIELFCMPPIADPREHPVEWAEFQVYNAQDVQAMRPVWHALQRAEVNPAAHAERSWAVRRMNARGVEVDVESAAYLLNRLNDAQASAEQAVFDRFGFKTSQVAKVREFLDLPNVQEGTVQAAIDARQLDADQLFVAEARLGLAGAARKKLKPLVNYAHPEDLRIRGGFIYHGAWTGRLTSLGVQFQNFVRHPSDEEFFQDLRRLPSEELFTRTRENIRGFLRAPEGLVLVGSDYKAIELRVGAWLAREDWLLDAFESGVDPYRIQAAAQFGLSSPAEVTDAERQYGKVVELAAMYGQGPDGFQKRRRLEGDNLPLDQCRVSIGIFRQTHPAFVHAWRECDVQLRRAICAPSGTFYVLEGLAEFVRLPDAVLIVRPSGATQVLWMPDIVEGRWPDGTPRDEIAFVAKDAQSGLMISSRTYGANVFQNLVQGVAFDLMIEALVEAERQQLYPVLSIHDEIVVEASLDDVKQVKAQLAEIMTTRDEWAEGLPIEVDQWVSRRFTKA